MSTKAEKFQMQKREKKQAKEKEKERETNLFAFDNIKFNNFTIANTSHGFIRIIALDSGLMNKHIFIFAIVAGDETITILNVKPLYSTSNTDGLIFEWNKENN